MEQTPPPTGMATMPVIVKMQFIGETGTIAVLQLASRLPAGVVPNTLKFPNIDPDNRLKVLEDLGIAVAFHVAFTEWDAAACVLEVYTAPIAVHCRLSEESVALAIGLFRNAGWEYATEKDKDWPKRWAELKETMAKVHHHTCSHHPNGPHPAGMVQLPQTSPLAQLFFPDGVPESDEVEEDDDPTYEEAKPKKRRRKKRRKPNKDIDHGGEEGTGDPVGP